MKTPCVSPRLLASYRTLRSAFAVRLQPLITIEIRTFFLVPLVLSVVATAALSEENHVVARYIGTAEAVHGLGGESVRPITAATQATPSAPVLTFDPAAVGVNPSSAQTLTATFAVSGYSGSFTPTATLHFGLNYSIGAVTCTDSGAGETCSVPIKFVPMYPGGRRDAVFLTDGTTRLATVLLGGVGQAPFAFTQTASSIVSSTPFPGEYLYQSQTDEDGTLYVLTYDHNIGVVTKAGVASIISLTGNPYVYSFSLDGAGVLYIQTSFGDQMITYDTVQGIQGTYALPSKDYWYASAFSISGSLFVLNQDTQVLWEFKPDGTTATTPITPSVNQDYQMTVDAAKDVFVSGYTINEITAGGTQTEVNTVGAWDGLAVDAANTLYATRYSSTGGVAVLSRTDYSTPSVVLDSSASPLGVSVGPDGTVNISNYTTLDVVDRSHSSTVIDFGNVGIGATSSAQAGAIYNGGNQSLIISAFTLDDADFSLDASQPNHCAPSIQVAAGAVCQIVATFTPAHAGKYSGTITVKSNSLNSSNSISTISVTGTSVGIYNVASPATLSFGSQNTGTTSAPKTETLTAQGYNESSQIQSLASNDPAFAVNAGTCTSSYSPGQSCQLSITFSPTTAKAYSATITVVSVIPGDNITTTTTFVVTGTGTQAITTATPVLTPGTGTYNSNQSVTITDSTAGAKIYYTTDGSAPSATSTLYSAPVSIAQNATTLKAIAIATGDANSAVASATYTLQVAKPTITPPGGTYSGSQTVSLTSTTTGAQIFYTTDGSDPSNGVLYSSPITIATTGTTLKAVGKLGGYEDSAVSSGTYTLQFPATSLSAGSLSFSNQTQGTTSAAKSSTLTNTGQAILQISGISVTGANPTDFAETNNCGASLAAGASCAISVTFTPAAATSYSASITIATNASTSPAVITLSGTGTAPPQGEFNVSASPANATAKRGAAALFTINVGTTGGPYNSAVTLTASGLPTGASASFSPASVTPGAGTANSVLTIQTSSTSANMDSIPVWPAGSLSLALLFFTIPKRQRRQWSRRLLLVLLMLASFSAATVLLGCGGHSKRPVTTTITVTATSGADSHSTTVELTVD